MSRLRLVAQGVEKRFGRVTALAGIDFAIEAGESVAILGANGAGKSTCLRLLAGIAKPSAGRFTASLVGVDEADATGPLARESLRGRVGYVGHATLLAGELTARENLVFAARLYGRRPTRPEQDALLFELGLEEVADRRVSTLSRGTAQRVSIARGVVHEPDLLLLDEPFTGLDEIAAARLSHQLARLREGVRALVVVTHDPQRAVELADRALLFHRGRIRATAGRCAAPAIASPGIASPGIASPGSASPAGPAPGELACAFDVESLRGALHTLAREDAAESEARSRASLRGRAG